jgi:Tol biopolymer transport system component
MRRMSTQLGLSGFLMLSALAGCATNRTYTILTTPPDATILIDGQEAGRGKATQEIKFSGSEDLHTIAARRLGYAEQSRTVSKADKDPIIRMDLGPVVKRISFRISPVPAVLSIDGKQVSPEPVASASRDLEFTVDAKDVWTSHVVRAERPGWKVAERTVAWSDTATTFELVLQPMTKNLSITSDPPGAKVKLAGREVGVTPLAIADHPFPVDPETGEVAAQTLELDKAGYDPVQATIAWEGGKSDYAVRIPPRSRIVRFVTDPPGGVVTIAGAELKRDADGVSMAELTFVPTDEAGALPTYTATISRKTADTEWYPRQVEVTWDRAQAEYRVPLREVLTRPVPLLELVMERTDEGWRAVPKRTQTIAMKDLTEGPGRMPPTQLTELPKGTVIDSLALSPDGSKIVYSIIQSGKPEDLRSQIMVMNSDGSGGAQMFTDGRSLDTTPSFTAGGDQIVFSSNRGGRNLAVWSMSAVGAPGITQLTTGDTNDLWPSIDGDARPRLYYQAFVDTRPDSRLYMTQLGTTIRTDLTYIGGSQPRVSPKADAVIFTAVNSQTRTRDIYRMEDRGGEPQNITNTPDIDEFDPAWNRDGSRIVFSADRASDPETGKNLDIWMIDVAQPERPVQITTNGSRDDSPAFDPTANFVYFRSNRGGDWSIWKAPTP